MKTEDKVEKLHLPLPCFCLWPGSRMVVKMEFSKGTSAFHSFLWWKNGTVWFVEKVSLKIPLKWKAPLVDHKLRLVTLKLQLLFLLRWLAPQWGKLLFYNFNIFRLVFQCLKYILGPSRGLSIMAWRAAILAGVLRDHCLAKEMDVLPIARNRCTGGMTWWLWWEEVLEDFRSSSLESLCTGTKQEQMWR